MNRSLYIGVDIGGTKTAVSLGTAGGKIRTRSSFSTPSGVEETISEVIGRIGRVRAHLEAEESEDAVAAIGISCGGPLDAEDGIIQSPPNLPGWDGIPVVEELTTRTGLSCYLENDANAGALAEWYWGNGRGCSDLVFLTFGTGLGAGLILNGRLYRGTSGLAGEIGHVRMTDSGPFGYGKNGSWEGHCSGGGIQRRYLELTGESRSAKEVCIAATEGEPISRKVIDESGRYLGEGISWLIDVLNPECIIIGSIFTRNEELFRPAVEDTVARETLSRSRADCRILPAGLGETLGDHAALGVALHGHSDKNDL